MLIYFAGPVDFGGGDLEGRKRFFDAITDMGHVIYDATSSLHCRPDRMDAAAANVAMDVHMTVLRHSDAFVAEFPSQTVGIAAELYEAHKHMPTAFKAALVAKDAPQSLYLMGMCDLVTDTWDDIIESFTE